MHQAGSHSRRDAEPSSLASPQRRRVFTERGMRLRDDGTRFGDRGRSGHAERVSLAGFKGTCARIERPRLSDEPLCPKRRVGVRRDRRAPSDRPLPSPALRGVPTQPMQRPAAVESGGPRMRRRQIGLLAVTGCSPQKNENQNSWLRGHWACESGSNERPRPKLS